MNNNKVYVKIGRKYRDAFKSICALVNGGCIDRSIILGCRDNRIIETEQYIFEYVGDVATIDTGDVTGMMSGGATWFRGFRGGESDSVMGIWHDLLELVSTNYHRQFSLVEFVQNTVVRDEEEEKSQQELIRRVAEGLDFRVSKIAPATQDESKEDLYALSLRMEIFSGIGEPKPLICKVYFRRKNGEFTPIPSVEASLIEGQIASIVSKIGGTDTSETADNETVIVDNVLNSLDRLIKGDMSRNFAEIFFVTNETDVETLEDFMENDSQEEIRLECKKLKVLGISHLQWIDPTYNVFLDNRKAFTARIRQGDLVSMYCCCGSPNNELIENSVICCVSPETGITTEIRLNTARDDLGISESDLKMIQRESAFADHFFPISCSELSRRGIECLRYRCKCNTVALEDGSRVHYKCTDCPYPEVVYRRADGTLAYTPTLDFDTATLRAVEEETETCRFCGRSYTRGGLNAEFYCKFCANAMETVKTRTIGDQHKKIYRRYAQMLPLRLRMSSVFKKKYGFENADRLLFFIGKKKYFFDKLSLTDTGMLQKPERRQ